MENYIHWSLIEKRFEIKIEKKVIENWDNIDVPKYLVNKTEMNEKTIKGILNGELSKKMTKELFEDLGAWEEVKGWFKTIRDLFNCTLFRGE